MELLIPGLILVALMVYASTRIKRIAAEAFEPETVETDDFTLEKPEGLLNVINRDPSLAFQAYSRDFGVDEAAEFRAVRAEIRVYENRSLDYATAAIREAVKVNSEISEIIDERKYNVLEAEMIERGIGFRELYKLTEKDGQVFELKIIELEDLADDLVQKAETMFATFAVK
jgi:hypothetical protein